MANEFKHKAYFRVKDTSNSFNLVTFTSTADARSKINFTSAFDTSSPTKTEALEDTAQTYSVVYEFNSKAEEDAFLTAISSFSDTTPWNTALPYLTEHFKTEWYDSDGATVETTTNL